MVKRKRRTKAEIEVASKKTAKKVKAVEAIAAPEATLTISIDDDILTSENIDEGLKDVEVPLVWPVTTQPKDHPYITPHGGVEFVPDAIYHALKKHLLVDGHITAQDLIKSIETELATLFAQGKADNVVDGIVTILNR